LTVEIEALAHIVMWASAFYPDQSADIMRERRNRSLGLSPGFAAANALLSAS
jgi:hypothetical protein